jgi:hypothetical protein
MRTWANQRRDDWSRSFLARRFMRPGVLHSAMAARPINNRPNPSPPMAVPMRQRRNVAMLTMTSNPHPRTASAIRE